MGPGDAEASPAGMRGCPSGASRAGASVRTRGASAAAGPGRPRCLEPRGSVPAAAGPGSGVGHRAAGLGPALPCPQNKGRVCSKCSPHLNGLKIHRAH